METATDIANPANYDWGVFASDLKENARARAIGVGKATLEAGATMATESFYMAGDTVNLALGRDVPLASQLAHSTMERMRQGESTGSIITSSAVDITANVVTVGMYGTAKEYSGIITDAASGRASIEEVESRLQGAAGQSVLNLGLGVAAARAAPHGTLRGGVRSPREIGQSIAQSARRVGARAKVVAESIGQIPGRAAEALHQGLKRLHGGDPVTLGRITPPKAAPPTGGIVNRGGRFANLDKLKQSGEVGHHMPQNASLKSMGLGRSDGPAVGMTKADHALTRTYAGRGVRAMRQDVNLSPRLRLAKDVRDIRHLFRSRYNQGLREMLDYAKTLDAFKKQSQ